MKNARTKHLEFVFGDILAIELAHGLMMFVCNGGHWLWIYSQLGILLVIIMLAALFFMEGYKNILNRGYLKELTAVCRQMAVVFCMEIVVMFVFQGDYFYSRWSLCAVFMLSILLIYTERVLMKKLLRSRFQDIKNSRTLMIIATAEQAAILVGCLMNQPLTIFRITGLSIIDKDMKGEKIQGIPVTADRNDTIDYICSNVVDEVLISIPHNPNMETELAKEILAVGLVVHIYTESSFQDLPNRVQERISGLNVLTCFNREVPIWMACCKWLLDFFGGMVGFVLTILVGLAIGPFIYIKSPGPILFSQIRVGRNGRKFRIYKFRSMYLDAEERKSELMERNKIKGHMFKIDDDPRIIPGIGHFIRRTSLDEFPQFFNVLKGEMSLVGTRPPTVDEYEKYSFYHNKRLIMKPGITGLWQIKGRSNVLDFEEVVRLDSEYIDGWTLEKDILIIFKTLLVIAKGSGSV